MLEEHGRVVALDGGLAMIETVRITSCQSCEAKSTCGQGSIAEVVGQKSCIISALNSLSLQVGDEVVVGLSESTLLKSALLVYLLPLVLMIAGAGGFQWLYGTNDLVAAFGGGIGFLAGFALVYLYNHQHKDDENFQPMVLRAAREEGLVRMHDQ
ncbi:MAG: SoxR reducing system RseC family protein [Pseudomonadales bacterium]|nr:SoxR reducing system RseC family protein [Pseudomonadales bacterium]